MISEEPLYPKQNIHLKLFSKYSFLPVEKKIDESVFFDTETALNVGADNLQIKLKTLDNKKQIIFTDSVGNSFVKQVGN